MSANLFNRLRSSATRTTGRNLSRRGRRRVFEALEDRQMLNGSSLLQILSNPTPADSDIFGQSVAVSENTVVVGASGDDTGATSAGAAYIFDATGNLLRTLNNPTPAASDEFGRAVSVSGNLVVVGAYYDDTGATNAGTAYVFDATTGNLLRTLNNPTPAASDQFGRSVSISGNLVVVGATGDDTGATDAGAAYVFNATTGELLRTLNNPTPADSDQFGRSVSVSENLVVVGANYDDTGAPGAGAAYVFNATTGSLLHTLNNPTPAEFDSFGWSVAVSGNTVVVGAIYDDTGATGGGSAYVFHTTTGNLLHTLNIPTPDAFDFGRSVSASGSLVVVGACSATNAGAAYVFDAATGNLLQTLDNPTPAYSDLFASSVAVSGSTVVVGSVYDDDDTGATNAGAAYVFGAADEVPWAAALTPANNATWIDGNTNLTIALSESVQKGTGNIVIKKAADGSVFESIDVNSLQVSVSGSIVTIDPSATLAMGTTYYVEVDSGAFLDLTGKAFAGINGPAAWSFTTLHDNIPLASLPALHSNPGASKSIYLDFNGHVEPVWLTYTNAATSVYDIDGDPTTLNDPELAKIRAIWAAVAEDFAPFNVDVTTVEPSVLAPGRPTTNADGVALRIAIGSEVNDWSANSSAAGSWGAFTDSSTPNVAFVFSQPTWSVDYLALLAAREAGYSCWVPMQAWNGVSLPNWYPLMTSGNIPDPSIATIWYDGTDAQGSHRDDMGILGGQFGYRPDDYGNTIASATGLTQAGNTWSGAGIIGTNADVDVFSFTVQAEGAYRITANAAAVAPNLDAVLELRNAAGQLIAVANPAAGPYIVGQGDLQRAQQNAQIVKSLTPGTYYVSVQSTGVYGWIGQYTVAIDNAPPAGISALATSRTLTTGEDGRQASFQVQLQTRPMAAVTIAVSSNSTSQGTVAVPSLSFTPDNWNVPQTVTVTGVNDAIVEGDVGYAVLLKPSSSDPAYKWFTTKVSITNLDNDTKFYVVNDATQNLTYEYATSGGSGESYGLNSGNTAPRGVASTAAGDKTWVVDANRKVYVYNTSGGLLGSWTAGTLNSKAKVEDITVYGNDVWIVDAYSDKVYKYAGAAGRTSGTQNATSSFSLNSSNRDPKGIVTDGTSLWVVNDSTSSDKVFKYSLTGQLLGSWIVDSHNAKPTGLTINPASPSSIWIVDSGTKSVYEYYGATSLTSGVRSALAVYALAPGNTNPQGIADPPAPASAVATSPWVPSTPISWALDAALEDLVNARAENASPLASRTAPPMPAMIDSSSESASPAASAVVINPVASTKTWVGTAERGTSAVLAVDQAITILADFDLKIESALQSLVGSRG